jgi:hypothetical protein
MEALIAVAVVFFLMWAKNHAVTGDPTLTAAGSLTVTASQAPTADPYLSSAGGPIGNTFLSETETYQDLAGNEFQLPYRPSAAHNGGGIIANYDVSPDASVNSVGSGIGAIEKLNAPVAAHTSPAGGFTRGSIAPSYGGRSTFLGRWMAPYGPQPVNQAPPAAPAAPQRYLAAPGARVSIATANTQGPRATSNSTAPMPAASGVDFHTAPPQATPALTTQQSAMVRRYYAL